MHNRHGFTIVELLIVIVVIGVLAAITIVAYNGMQDRVKNTKTLAAANAWIKVIKQYNAVNGTLPSEYSCLGGPTTYPDNGQCWDGSTWTVRAAFLNQVQPYIGPNYPEPDLTDLHNGGVGSPKRGVLYIASTKEIYVMLIGTGACPDVGIGAAARAVYGSGIRCAYTFN
jgi:prepilin-type N-terminal cleavage/methylation domain-containing protein